MSYEIVGEGVLHFPGYFSKSDALVNFLESTVSSSIPNWKPWLSGGDDTPEEYGLIKLIQRKDIKSDSEEIQLKISDVIGAHDDSTVDAFLEYLQYLGTSEANIQKIKNRHLSSRPPSFTLKKYHEGKDLGPHPDWGQKTPAVFTVAVYLSDTYEGGNFIFPDLNKKVELIKGSVVIFPSIFIHQSTKVLSGTKYLTNEIVFVDSELLDGVNPYA